jgi:mono/diheme cytochrome c family protein
MGTVPIFVLAAIAGSADVAADSAATPGAPAVRARPLLDYTLERTPERRARGEYLVEGLLQCFVCHSELDWSAPGAPPKPGRKGGGKILREDADRRLVAPNITPDVDTGAGKWTDDMFARAIREGIGHDGRALSPHMWYGGFRALADEDLAAVIVYVRSIPAVRNALPPTILSAGEREEVAHMPRPLTEKVTGPDPADPLARGRYLVHLANCEGCHTSWHSSRMPGLLAGGNEIERDGHTAFSTNITSHATGAGYDAAAFINVIRTGKGGTLSGIMPWGTFRNLDDADLTAIHTTLRRVNPVLHYVNNIAPPTHCVVCGQDHGLGEANVLEPTRAAVDLDQALYDEYAGTYFSREYDLAVTVVRTADGVAVQEEDRDPIALIPQSPTYFLAPGEVAPVSFERDERGRVARLVSHEILDVVFERQER